MSSVRPPPAAGANRQNVVRRRGLGHVAEGVPHERPASAPGRLATQCHLADAKYEIRQVLDRYREKYRMSAKQVNQAVWGYVDDLLDDFFFEKEEALKAEIEEDIERENQRPSSGAP